MIALERRGKRESREREREEFSRLERIFPYFFKRRKLSFLDEGEFLVVVGGDFVLGFEELSVLRALRRKYEKGNGRYTKELKSLSQKVNGKPLYFKFSSVRKELYPEILRMFEKGVVVNPYLFEALIVDFVELSGGAYLNAECYTVKERKEEKVVFFFPNGILAFKKLC